MVLAAEACRGAAVSVTRTLDLSHLPEFEISSNAPLWWGQAMLALIEGTMFGVLLAIDGRRYRQ